MDASINDFVIADLPIRIIFAESRYNGMHLLHSFEPFRVSHIEGEPYFEMTVDDSICPIPKVRRERIRTFETGNGDTVVDLLDDGGYQFIIRDLRGYDCCMLQSDKGFHHCRAALNGNYDMRCFGLNNAMMLAFGFCTAKARCLLIHASLVRKDGYGYAFIAKSGTGKSTQVSNWLRNIPGCDLMNDDNPIVRVIDGQPYIFGSPWSGKTPCYRNVKARLGAITRIDRASENSVDKLSPIQAFANFLPSCSSMKWDKDIYHEVCDTVTQVVETTGIYILHCLPDAESAWICYRAISCTEMSDV